MKNLAVIFPGMGYNTDRPLLYYAGKIVKKYEFEIVRISYGNLPDTNMEKLLEYALTAANAAVNKISFEEYDRIFFISKSIGTAVAGMIQQRIPRNVHQIFFTPITESVPFLCTDSLVFTGNRDSWVHISDIIKQHEKNKFELHVVKNADHSLETGDICRDIALLGKVELFCEQYIIAHIKEDGGEE